MSLSSHELAQIVSELSPTLLGQQVQKIVQPDRETVVLSFRSALVLLSAHPRLGRFHLVQERPPGAGVAAPPFCMLLRKELINARLRSLVSVKGERALELGFQRAGEQRALRLFLYGKSAQLQLVDGAGQVLGAIGPARRFHEGLPPPREPVLDARFGESPGVAERAAAFYGQSAVAEVAEADRSAIFAKFRTELKRALRLDEALQKDEARARTAEPKRKWADLLLAHVVDVPRGAASVTLPDDFSFGEPIDIPLNPALSPTENAARLYKDHRRAERGLATIARRRAEVRTQIEALSARLKELEHAPSEALSRLERAPAPAQRSRERAARKPPYRTFTSGRGATILVGRGAEKNDELTFHVARGNDLWLHARDVPGAHVVVPLLPARSADPETLLDAALLAAHYSNARDESQVDVTYTLRKHVRKARGKAGAVLTSSTKTIRVRVDLERLKRLLSTVDDR